jgi:hypothetical protein
MTLVLLFFSIATLFEIIAAQLPRASVLWRGLAVSTAAGLLLAATIYVGAARLDVFSCLICSLSLYRIINLLRIYKSRVHHDYLRRTCLRTTCWLAAAQIETLLLRNAWDKLTPAPWAVWTILITAQTVGAVWMLHTVYRHIRHASATPNVKAYSTAELPTVTIAVAARNQTDSLMDCIESLLASDYPKLEILVLDDCSQTRRTPEIIRSFAHQGVRFIPGDEPAPAWLARNQAYDTLARAASGDYLLFCSTALRLQPESVRKMISYSLYADKAMLSVIPSSDIADGRFPFIETIRAVWELMPPRRWLGRPPVSSACWLIRTSALHKAGGFAAVSRMVTPEAYFARRQTVHDRYSFAPGGAYYGVSAVIDVAAGRSKITRTSYPSLHRRPEMVALTTAGYLVFGMLPFVQLLLGPMGDNLWPISIFSLPAVILLLLAYNQVLRLSYGTATAGRIATFPAVVGAAIIMQHYSMYKYEFSEVLWKDRNICLPVMHVVPRMPDISEQK